MEALLCYLWCLSFGLYRGYSPVAYLYIALWMNLLELIRSNFIQTGKIELRSYMWGINFAIYLILEGKHELSVGEFVRVYIFPIFFLVKLELIVLNYGHFFPFCNIDRFCTIWKEKLLIERFRQKSEVESRNKFHAKQTSYRADLLQDRPLTKQISSDLLQSRPWT